MPLSQIFLKTGKPSSFRRALMNNVYKALRDTFNVPEGDFFVTVTEHDDAGFAFGPDYLGIERTGELVMIRITANDTRSRAQKLALYKRIVELLTTELGLRSEDVLICLVEVAPENWSLGNGVAQYAPLST